MYANIEDKRAKDRRWYWLNKERKSLYCKKWYKKNKERARKNNEEWTRKNRHKRNAAQSGRNKARKQATPGWANEFFISEIYHLAELRKKFTGIDWHVDHIVPIKNKLVCGLHVEHNLRVIPAVANLRKYNTFTGG